MVLPCITSTAKNDTPAHVRQDYIKVLDDDFSSGTIDPNNFSTELRWGEGRTLNNEEQYYVNTQDPANTYPNPFVFNADGNLEIVATPINGAGPVTNGGIAGGQNYWSGVLQTRPTANIKYGYVEFCAKTPGTFVDGAWPAGWLLHTGTYANAQEKNDAENGGTGTMVFNPEIDITEQVHGLTTQGAQCSKNAYHYRTGDQNDVNTYRRWSLTGFDYREFSPITGQQFSSGNVYNSCGGIPMTNMPESCLVDLSQDFHTYAVDWTPDYINYYLDGQIVNCIENPEIISDQEMYFIINLAVGGTFPFNNGQLADPADWPASLEIQYIKMYQYA